MAHPHVDVISSMEDASKLIDIINENKYEEDTTEFLIRMER